MNEQEKEFKNLKTVKEISEDIWEAFDACAEWITFECGKMSKIEVMKRLSDSIKKVLPRPKQKVKKEMWANIYINEFGNFFNCF